MSTPSLDFLDTAPVVPVIAIESLEHAVPLAQALVSGGICNLEITLRTACAIEAIQMISNEVPGAHVGAGTVCNAEQFDAVVEAGAKFVVSPGQSALLFERSLLTNIPLLPGAVTATEIMAAREAGFTTLKFFPASTSGGAPAIQAFSGPFSDLCFVPTGGIDLTNAHSYLALSNVRAVGGSWLTPADAIRNERWDEIAQLAHNASQLRI